ncbi:MAG: hypothetical protein AAGB19_04740 [Cyanobacteria bacterium P01_F01_bin.3]
MTDPVLSQLVSVEADLTEQVEQLESQLTQLQTQRSGLRTVIELFGEDDAAPAAKTSKSTKASTPTKTRTKAASRSSATKKTASKATSTKKQTKAKPGRKLKKQTPGRKKKDGRAATWQKHVKSQYRDLALPESVSSVLRSQPSEIFTIADIMTTIFKEDMPKTSYLKARNRISNILSAGARDGTWYRGRNGRYSQSESVTKIK